MEHANENPNEARASKPRGFFSWASDAAAWINARSKRERLVLALTALLAVLGASGAGLLLGYMASQNAVPYEARRALDAWIEKMRGPQPDVPVEHSTVRSIYHTIDIARLPLGRAWSIEDVGGNIVYASRLGRLGFVTPDYRAAGLGVDTPMNLEGLRQSALMANSLFEISRFRTTDLLSIETAPGRFDLYAAHHRFDDECIRIAVSRLRLTATEAHVQVVSPEWEQVYQSRDCIRPKSMGAFFAGDQGGGRLVRMDDDRLALSIGDFQFDGVNSEIAYSMDPASDLGKIIEITLSTGAARVLASGLRNPQGLLMSREGVLWETEHGPQGGDEVNRIRAGANYGWPNATYGARYANRPTAWPLSNGLGDHGGYEHPYFVFMPSIGISNIIEPDPRGFPNWRGHLLTSALKDMSIYLLRIEGDRILFAEPIEIANTRVRDLINLRDGRIAIAGDDGDIRILTDSESEASRAGGETLTGLETLGPPIPEESNEIDDPERWGALMFGLHCSQCHTVTGDVRVGPPLNGLIGRQVGGFAGYEYSEALAGRTERWTERRLREFARNPEAAYPGTSMTQPYMEEGELDVIIEFIRSRPAQGSSEGASQP